MSIIGTLLCTDLVNQSLEALSEQGRSWTVLYFLGRSWMVFLTPCGGGGELYYFKGKAWGWVGVHRFGGGGGEASPAPPLASWINPW